MPARRSANSQRIVGLHWGRSVCLLGLLLAGCQSAPLRSSFDRQETLSQVSETTVAAPRSGGEIWGPRPSHPNKKNDLRSRDRQGVVFISAKTPLPNGRGSHSFRTADSVNQPHIPFELVCWQSEEPPPLVSGESRLIVTNPPSANCLAADCLAADGPRICLRCDIEHALPRLWSDTQALANWNNAFVLTAAGGLAISFRESDLDQDVRDNVAQHPLRWGDGSKFFGNVGDVKYQAPVMLGLYGYSVWQQDEELHDLMGTMLSASVITGVSTSALKLITNTDRPSDKWFNGEYGFPSYHTASTFAIAAVLDEYYGYQIGLPAYAVATAVGFSRIDEQDHDLSDVVFGAALGFVIGRTVAAQHLCEDSKWQFSPYVHPTDGTPGVAWEVKF